MPYSNRLFTLDLVNKPFSNKHIQKMSADVLGVRLSKQEVEQSSRVIKADIVTYAEKEAPQRTTTDQTKSSMCELQ